MIYTIHTHTHIHKRAPIHPYTLLADILLHTTYKPQSKPAILFSNHFCKPALFDFHASLAMYIHLFLISLFSLCFGICAIQYRADPVSFTPIVKGVFLFQLYRVLEARHGLYLPTRGFPRNDGDKREGRRGKKLPEKEMQNRIGRKHIHIYTYLTLSCLGGSESDF